MSSLIQDPGRGVTLEVIVEGEGTDVVLLASALRGAADFAQLQADLAEAGFRSIAINMRGVGQSRGPQGELTLTDLADDVATVIAATCSPPVHLVGHALGNIIARATASYRPDVARSVTVMPCGGHNISAHPVSDEVLRHFARCHDESLSDAERLESLGVAFFAPGNDASSWLGGWWPGAGPVSAAVMRADPETWWRGGTTPMLILQPVDDAMTGPAAGRESAAAIGERATYVEIPHCGHAILPEQPRRVADEIIKFLRSQP
jgi:pimeloyl-ACP methyl ester carboxylesterase